MCPKTKPDAHRVLLESKSFRRLALVGLVLLVQAQEVLGLQALLEQALVLEQVGRPVLQVHRALEVLVALALELLVGYLKVVALHHRLVGLPALLGSVLNRPYYLLPYYL